MVAHTGIPELRQAAARHSESYNGISVDWQTEALVTSGATEGLAAAFIGMINEGDEVSFLAHVPGVSRLGSKQVSTCMDSARRTQRSSDLQAVILDPMYDGYSSMCRRSGAKLIPLR